VLLNNKKTESKNVGRQRSDENSASASQQSVVMDGRRANIL
jgi:hypothetical protein